MELKPGYKQTEVGVIPVDWEVKSLGSFISLRRGHDLTARQRCEGKVPVMGSAGPNGFHDTALVRGPGVVIGRSGASYGQAHYCESAFWPHNTALYVTDFLGNDTLFAFYFLRAIDFSRHNSGGAQQSLNRNFIAPILIAAPTLAEQEAIAEALSDADALIDSLEQLIAKKRLLKQGAMQDLLTGHKRLPGFEGEWERRMIGDIAVTLKGSGISKSKVTDRGQYPCILYGDLFTKYGRKIDQVTSFTNSEEGLKTMAGDVLMPGSTTTTGIDLATASAVLTPGVSLGGDINVIRCNLAECDPIFLASYLTHIARGDIAQITQGITIHHLYGRNLKELSVSLPPLTEQTAIATILSDMDAEIATLEAKLAKARTIKQGMMQELLTGKTRLI